MLRGLCRAALAASVLSLALGASTAWAHSGPGPGAVTALQSSALRTAAPTETIAAASPAALDGAAAWLALAVVLLAAVVSRRWSRRLAVLAMVVLLATFSVETAVHSVHHLDRARAGGCVIAAASANVVGDVPSPVAVALPLPAPAEGVAVCAPPSVTIPRHAPDHGRAPPA